LSREEKSVDTRQNDWDASTYYRNEAVAGNYDRVRFASFPGQVFNALERAAVRRIFRRLPKDSIVLDAPCGTGRFAAVLLEMGFRVVGVDISEDMLDVAREKLRGFGSRFQTRALDVTSLPSDGQRYDGALCARLLMHLTLDEQVAVIRAVARVTDGIVSFNESINTPYHRARRRVKAMLGNRPPARSPITRAQVRELAERADVSIDHEIWVAPLLSEDVFFVGRPNSR
jgi:ubiquinone/menaquinone biosynthesis C-methylase UbiE